MKGNMNKNSPEFESINERYIESLQQILLKKNFLLNLHINQHKHQSNSYTQQQHIILEIKQAQLVKTQQDKFYFNLMKNLYNQRKIVNPDMTLQSFLAVYNQQLSQKLKKFQIHDKVKGQTIANPSTKLNKLIMQNELKILTSQTIKLIQSKKSQINQLQSQSQKINQQYYNLIENLILKPTELNIQNLQLQVKLKLKEQQRKNSLMKKYTKNKEIKSSIKKTNQNKIQDNKNDIKQQIQRIKTVVKNNMWGYGEQINQRLQKLKSLKSQPNLL